MRESFHIILIGWDILAPGACKTVFVCQTLTQPTAQNSCSYCAHARFFFLSHQALLGCCRAQRCLVRDTLSQGTCCSCSAHMQNLAEPGWMSTVWQSLDKQAGIAAATLQQLRRASFRFNAICRVFSPLRSSQVNSLHL